MNQILQVQENRNQNKKPIDVKKVVLFFAICLIIFGLILLGQGAYNFYLSKQNKKVNPISKKEETPSISINLEQLEENKLKINVNSEIAISHIVYNWNSETPTTLNETGKTSVEELLQIPAGENTIYVSVIDSNGNETKKQQTYTIETTKPVIELAVLGNDIKISVTSEYELSYVSYKWNSDEEIKDDMYTYEDKTKFEKSVEIPKGQNTLKIIAEDINGETSEKSQNIKGVTKAKTTVLANGEYLEFTVTGEDNIKKVQFEFNGKPFLMDSSTYGETNIVHYRLKLTSGMNYLKIISTTINDAEDTSVWKYEYNN